MKKVKWRLETGFVSCIHEGEFEVDNDVPEEEIAEQAKEEAFNWISWSYEVEESEGE